MMRFEWNIWTFRDVIHVLFRVSVCLNICQTTNMFYQKWMMFSKFNSSKQVFETFRLKPKLHIFSQRLEGSLQKFFLTTSRENSLKCAWFFCYI